MDTGLELGQKAELAVTRVKDYGFVVRVGWLQIPLLSL